jgi:hypothetical protein
LLSGWQPAGAAGAVVGVAAGGGGAAFTLDLAGVGVTAATLLGGFLCFFVCVPVGVAVGVLADEARGAEEASADAKAEAPAAGVVSPAGVAFPPASAIPTIMSAAKPMMARPTFCSFFMARFDNPPSQTLTRRPERGRSDFFTPALDGRERRYVYIHR